MRVQLASGGEDERGGAEEGRRRGVGGAEEGQRKGKGGADEVERRMACRKGWSGRARRNFRDHTSHNNPKHIGHTKSSADGVKERTRSYKISN